MDTLKRTFKLGVGNRVQLGSVLNQPPTDIALSVSAIAENNAIGAIIGTLSTTDADAGDTFIYELVAGFGDNASFTIDGANLKAGIAFDYETKNSYSIRVKSTDSKGGSFEKVFTITINDVDESVLRTSGSVDTTGISATGGGLILFNDEFVGNGVLTKLEVNIASISSGTCTAKLIEIDEAGKIGIKAEATLNMVAGLNTFVAGVDIPAWTIGKFQTIGIFYPTTCSLRYRSSGGKGYYYYVGDLHGSNNTFSRTPNGQVLIKITLLDSDAQITNTDSVATESFNLTAIPSGWLNAASYSADGTKIVPVDKTGNVPLYSNKTYGAANREIFWQFKFTDAAATIGFGSRSVEGGVNAGSLITVKQTVIEIRGITSTGAYNSTVIKSQALNANLVVGNKYNIRITKSGRSITATITGESDSVNTVISNEATPLGYSTYPSYGYNQGALHGSPSVFAKDGSVELYQYSHTMLTSKKLKATVHGDSITEGFTVADNQTFGALLKSHFGNGNILVSGIGGAISVGLMKRMRQEVTDSYPEYGIIHIGTNSTGDTNYNNNIAMICTMLKFSGVKPIVCTIPTSSAKTGTIKAIGTDILVAEIDVPLTTSGAGSTVVAADYEGVDSNGGAYNDGTHPNSVGHSIMYDVIFAKMT